MLNANSAIGLRDADHIEYENALIGTGARQVVRCLPRASNKSSSDCSRAAPDLPFKLP